MSIELFKQNYDVCAAFDKFMELSLKDVLVIFHSMDDFSRKVIVQAHTFLRTEDGKFLKEKINESVSILEAVHKFTKKHIKLPDYVVSLNIYRALVDVVKMKLPKEIYDNLYIKKSEIHGNGVFTSKKIEVFKIIDIYPAHGITYYDLDDTSENYYYYGDDMTREDVKKYRCENVFKFNNYLVGPVGDKNKTDKYKAHMINSCKNSNCALFAIRGLHYIFSIKPIEKDEELTIYYGENYKHE